jgi:hypothetical protein
VRLWKFALGDASEKRSIVTIKRRIYIFRTRYIACKRTAGACSFYIKKSICSRRCNNNNSIQNMY